MTKNKLFKGIWNRIKTATKWLLKGLLSKLLGCDKKKNGTNSSNSNTAQATSLSDYVNSNSKKGFLTGIDIHETNNEINWKEVEKAGISFVYIKATEGIYFPQNHPVFINQWTNVAKTTILRGAYFYYVTDRLEDTPEKQAKNFIDSVLTVHKPTDLPPALDIEKIDFSNVHRDQLEDNLLIWLGLVEKAFGKQPIIYTNRYYYKKILASGKLKDYPVWIADPDSKEQPGASNWVFWQNKLDAVVPFINDKVDLNRFKGNLSELKQLVNHNVP
ncbi:glycoside hydrolase family 25 protein [Psychroserpens sp.]|uniref:glycoside hydrolase family 25 protein n=1 Tax=Psychroserpens sp. TaxID=2020870 RepID=UPI002B2716DF|nr:GH25 family lysozyme [Psychroserpens sp.]